MVRTVADDAFIHGKLDYQITIIWAGLNLKRLRMLVEGLCWQAKSLGMAIVTGPRALCPLTESWPARSTKVDLSWLLCKIDWLVLRASKRHFLSWMPSCDHAFVIRGFTLASVKLFWCAFSSFIFFPSLSWWFLRPISLSVWYLLLLLLFWDWYSNARPVVLLRPHLRWERKKKVFTFANLQFHFPCVFNPLVLDFFLSLEKKRKERKEAYLIVSGRCKKINNI